MDLSSVLLFFLLLGHRSFFYHVRGPIEIGPFLLIIRARAPKVRGPIEIGPFLLIIIIQAL